MKTMKKNIPLLVCICAALMVGCGQQAENSKSSAEETMSTTENASAIQDDISQSILRKEVYALVSSAENSTTDYSEQYGYIEDIGDGRGYTAGIIGFTSGTGDMLDVVNRYAELKPDNELEKYIPALEKAVGSDTHEGLGEAFESDWAAAAECDEMKQAQNDIVDEQYMNVALEYARADGLRALGQYIYYDALVMHGSGDGADCFEAIRNTALANAKTPSDGGSESRYLTAFLDAREPVMQMEEAHADLSRLTAQRKFLSEENYSLVLPLEWTMYGDDFTLTYQDLADK